MKPEAGSRSKYNFSACEEHLVLKWCVSFTFALFYCVFLHAYSYITIHDFLVAQLNQQLHRRHRLYSPTSCLQINSLCSSISSHLLQIAPPKFGSEACNRPLSLLVMLFPQANWCFTLLQRSCILTTCFSHWLFLQN